MQWQQSCHDQESGAVKLRGTFLWSKTMSVGFFEMYNVQKCKNKRNMILKKYRKYSVSSQSFREKCHWLYLTAAGWLLKLHCKKPEIRWRKLALVPGRGQTLCPFLLFANKFTAVWASSMLHTIECWHQYFKQDLICKMKVNCNQIKVLIYIHIN